MNAGSSLSGEATVAAWAPGAAFEPAPAGRVIAKPRRVFREINDGVLTLRRLARDAFSFAKEDGGSKFVARLKRCCDLASNRDRHREVVAATADERFRTIRRLQPKIGLKYLLPRYLVKDLSTDERAAVFTHHYAVLEKRFDGEFVKALLSQGLSPWRYQADAGAHSVGLCFSHPTDNEGELTLEYRHDGKLIYLMSFSFAPGSLVGRPDETIVLLTRVQGAKNDFEAVRAAMKDLRGLSGPSLLLAALQGLVLATGSTTILAVSAQAQVCLTDGPASTFVTAYDEFFEGAGGVRHSDRFYRLTVPLAERPLSEVKSNNRARVRFQRERKQEVLEAFRLMFRTVA